MPTLTVWSMLRYLTEIGVKWRDEDFVSRNIVKIVKDEPFNGYFNLKFSGGTRRFDQQNGHTLLPALYGGMAKKIGGTIAGEFSIVPIPNSDGIASSAADFRTLVHVRAIAAAIGPRATAIDALRWNGPKDKAHQGGSRNPQVHFDNLRVTKPVTGTVILFDDVMTTGSQLIGSYRRLARDAVAPGCAFVIGRTAHEQHDKMSGWVQEEAEITERPLTFEEIMGIPLADL